LASGAEAPENKLDALKKLKTVPGIKLVVAIAILIVVRPICNETAVASQFVKI
jgi:hypothetical protein